MKFNLIETVELMDFEKSINVDLVVSERRNKNLPRFYVSFERSGIIQGPLLIGSTGNGNTIDELEDFCNKNCKNGCSVTFLGRVCSEDKNGSRAGLG